MKDNAWTGPRLWNSLDAESVSIAICPTIIDIGGHNLIHYGKWIVLYFGEYTSSNSSYSTEIYKSTHFYNKIVIELLKESSLNQKFR